MENTRENKEKFFAQYWGQDIIKVNMPLWGNKTRIVDSITLESDSLNFFFLELKTLSQISDEDAMGLLELYRVSRHDGDEYNLPANRLIHYGKKLLKLIIGEEKTISRSAIFWRDIQRFTIDAIDFFRSRGYALPWNGLSVEKLVEYGWIKIL